MIEMKTCHGQAVLPYIDDLAALRITVFRAFPYLYEGTPAYEAQYISTYAKSADSLFVLALDQGKVIGASTGLPMLDETAEFQAPFIEQGLDPASIFYFGESVLLPQYRGQGIGVRFFEQREAYARQLQRFSACCFCAVERAESHVMRPKDYQPLDAFWHKRGYRKAENLRTHYSWLDVGDVEETSKPMAFWIKDLI